MEPSFDLGYRSRRLCYWNAEPRAIDKDLMAIEHHIKRLGDVTITRVERLDQDGIFPCDLLVVGGQSIIGDQFAPWLQGIRKRILTQGTIWTPALIIAEISFDTLSQRLMEAVKDNWYFDIVSPKHLASLPIRVANLLRIHDHLHELNRYAQAIEDIQNQVRALEAQLSQAGTRADDTHEKSEL